MADPWENIDQYLAAKAVRIGPPTRAQTTGGAHVPGSLHYKGRARDYGRSTSDLRAIIETLRPHAVAPDPPIEELFGLNTFIDKGTVFQPSKGLWASHQDHVHVALRAGRTLPIPAPTRRQPVADNADLPNITGPVTYTIVQNADGTVRGYYCWSPVTGEIHTYGDVPYLGRSEVVDTL